MMNQSKGKLTLDRPVTYQIKVPGVLDASWAVWASDMTITVENEGDDDVTILTGAFDQAALHGLLRRLYGHGRPLISVTHIEDS